MQGGQALDFLGMRGVDLPEKLGVVRAEGGFGVLIREGGGHGGSSMGR